MFCKKCGMKIKTGAAVCPHCGESAELAEYCGGFWGLTASAPADNTSAGFPDDSLQTFSGRSAGRAAEKQEWSRARTVERPEEDRQEEFGTAARDRKRAARDGQKIRLLSIAAGAALLLAVLSAGGCIAERRDGRALSYQYEQLSVTNAELGKENEELKVQIQGLQDDSGSREAALESERQTIQTENESLKGKTGEYEAQISELEQEKADLEKELEEIMNGSKMIGTIIYDGDSQASYAYDSEGNVIFFYDEFGNPEAIWNIAYNPENPFSYAYDEEHNPIHLYDAYGNFIYENPAVYEQEQQAIAENGSYGTEEVQETDTGLTEDGLDNVTSDETLATDGMVPDDSVVSDTSVTDGGSQIPHGYSNLNQGTTDPHTTMNPMPRTGGSDN